MKTVYKFIYLFIPHLGCGMGVQSEDLDTVSTSTHSNPAIEEMINELRLKNASETSNTKPTSTIEIESNGVTLNKNDEKIHKRRNTSNTTHFLKEKTKQLCH
jgi:hypothetical protein